MPAPHWIRQAGRSINNNSSTILSGVAIAGVIITAVLAAKASPIASAKLVEAEQDKVENADEVDSDHEGTLTVQDKIKAVWKVYIPTALVGASTIACIIGSNRLGSRNNAALLAAYTLADTAFRDYKEEVIKQFGKNKDEKVVDEIAKRHVDNTPVSTSQVIVTAGGDQLCFDHLTGRYFKSDIETIRQSVNEINHRMLSGDMYASLNEFYALLGLASVGLGEELGFNFQNLIDIAYTSTIADDGRPALAISFKELPRKDYGKCF